MFGDNCSRYECHLVHSSSSEYTTWVEDWKLLLSATRFFLRTTSAAASRKGNFFSGRAPRCITILPLRNVWEVQLYLGGKRIVVIAVVPLPVQTFGPYMVTSYVLFFTFSPPRDLFLSQRANRNKCSKDRPVTTWCASFDGFFIFRMILYVRHESSALINFSTRCRLFLQSSTSVRQDVTFAFYLGSQVELS
jgi:hypothetical protein